MKKKRNTKSYHQTSGVNGGVHPNGM